MNCCLQWVNHFKQIHALSAVKAFELGADLGWWGIPMSLDDSGCISTAPLVSLGPGDNDSGWQQHWRWCWVGRVFLEGCERGVSDPGPCREDFLQGWVLGGKVLSGTLLSPPFPFLRVFVVCFIWVFSSSWPNGLCGERCQMMKPVAEIGILVL